MKAPIMETNDDVRRARCASEAVGAAVGVDQRERAVPDGALAESRQEHEVTSRAELGNRRSDRGALSSCGSGQLGDVLYPADASPTGQLTPVPPRPQ